MRDAITALRAALSSLEQARSELPDDLASELDGIIEQARSVLGSLGDDSGAEATADEGPADATG